MFLMKKKTQPPPKKTDPQPSESVPQDYRLIYKDGNLRKRGLNMIQSECGLKETLRMFPTLK